ncbi:hypothetical protein F2Q69_00059999 [Brassica cretica]|uniref:Uncharacterized protein n=1 Tax=Brassica cretica TaxID=69181 RepID=A0A8S9RBV5_BRACR|nr:hypothetical protein F2Q69_00059999 [Brassica cretica]
MRKDDLWELVKLGESRHSMDEPSVPGRTEAVLGRTKGGGGPSNNDYIRRSDIDTLIKMLKENGIKVSQDQNSGGGCPRTSPPPMETTEQPHLHHEGGEETGAQESSSDRRGEDLASHDQGGVETTQDGVETDSVPVGESSGDETQEEAISKGRQGSEAQNLLRITRLISLFYS